MTRGSGISRDTLPEWSKGVDSSSTSASCVGSNPTGVIQACTLHVRWVSTVPICCFELPPALQDMACPWMHIWQALAKHKTHGATKRQCKLAGLGAALLGWAWQMCDAWLLWSVCCCMQRRSQFSKGRLPLPSWVCPYSPSAFYLV